MAAKVKKKKHINLLPKSDFELSYSGRILRWALTTFRMIVIVVELVVISGFLSRFWLDIRNSDLDDEIDQKVNLIKSYSTFEADFRQTQSKLADYKIVTDPDNYALEALEQISRRVPPGVVLTSIQKDGEVIKIIGDSVSEIYIAQFVSAIEKIETLGAVSLTKLESDQRSEFISFNLEIQT